MIHCRTVYGLRLRLTEGLRDGVNKLAFKARACAVSKQADRTMPFQGKEQTIGCKLLFDLPL